jgi:hypothetical protein
MHALFIVAALLSASPQSARPTPPPNAVEGPTGVSPRFFQRVLGNSFPCPSQVHLIYYFDAQDGFRQVDRSGPGQLLSVRLPAIRLGDFARWNELVALPVIEQNPVLIEAENKFGLTRPPTSTEVNMLITPPGDPQIPHLPQELASGTLEHDLDEVATAFNEAVLLGVCEQTHMIGARPTNDWRPQD